MTWHNEYERHALSAMGIKTGRKYKILAVIPQQNNKMVKFLNSKKEDYETNLKTLQKGGAKIAYAGLSDEKEDIEQYNKFAKPKKYVALAGKELKGLDANIRDVIPPSNDRPSWEVEVSLYNSLGEQGGEYNSFDFDSEPTLKEIRGAVKDYLVGTKRDYNAEIKKPFGSDSFGGREEMQLKAIRKLNLR